MITEVIFSIILENICNFIGLLPSIPFEIPSGILNGLSHLFYGVGWFLPLSGLIPIFSISMAILGFRISMAIAKYILDVVGTVT